MKPRQDTFEQGGIRYTSLPNPRASASAPSNFRERLFQDLAGMNS